MTKTSLNARGTLNLAVAGALLLVASSLQASDTDGRIESSAQNSHVFKHFLAAPGKTVDGEIDDASITAHVKASLRAHPSTRAIKTKVETTGGVVTLTGVAKNSAQKSLVTKLVTDIDGVTSVVNNMTVPYEVAANHQPPCNSTMASANTAP
jgi:osmotically-inducible protein OsmY